MTLTNQPPALRPELRAYEAALPQLMTRQKGKFAVIHGNDFTNFFDNEGAALEWAYENYGLDPFFVKQVSEEENVAHFIRDVGPCRR